MNVKELLEHIEFCRQNGWLNDDTEIVIEDDKDDNYHISGWNFYMLFDHVFSLTIGEPFTELEYEQPPDHISLKNDALYAEFLSWLQQDEDRNDAL